MPSDRSTLAGGAGSTEPRPHGPELAQRVLYRDEGMIILDKPAGIAVHKGSGRGDNLEAHFEQLRFGAPSVPALAHRLDKDTSGCLVLGRNTAALARLGKLFRNGQVDKTYWAVITGVPTGSEGEISAPLARRSHDKRSWWMRVTAPGDPDGDPSSTRWRLLGQGDGIAWLELVPLTGRTHQLRVHCQHMGCPIAGDRLYGGDRALAASRHLQLHARRVSVPVGGGAPPVVAQAPVPEHMRRLLANCGWAPTGADLS